MPSRLFLYLLILTIPLSGPVAYAVEGQSRQLRYLSIWEELRDADMAIKQKEMAKALYIYKDCLKGLRSIEKEDPQWERAMVQARIRDTTSRINELQPMVDALPPDQQNPNMGENPPQPPPPTTSPEEVSQLKARIIELEDKVKGLQSDLDQSRGQVTTLRTQLQTVNDQLAQLKQKPADTQTADLMAENAKLKDRLAQAEAQVKILTNGSPDSQVTQLKEQLDIVEKKLADSEMSNHGLQQSNDALKQALDQAKASLEDSNRKLAENQDPIARREVEVLKAFVLRQQQEEARRDATKRLALEELDRLKIKSKTLRQKIDILGGPITPMTEEEKEILKNPPPLLVSQEGNTFTASKSGQISPSSTPAPGPAPVANVASSAATNSVAEVPSPTTTPSPAPTSTVSSTPDSISTAGTNAAPQVSILTPPPSTEPATKDTPAPNQQASTTPPPDLTQPNAQNTVIVDTNGPAKVADNNSVSSSPSSSTPPTVAGKEIVQNTTPTPTPSEPSPAPNSTTPTNLASPAPKNTASNPSPTSTPNVNLSQTTTQTNDPANTAPPNNNGGEAPTKSVLPPTTTETSDTTVKQGKDPEPGKNDPDRLAKNKAIPDEMMGVAQKAIDLYRNGRYADAADQYQIIITKFPECLYAWVNYGVVLYQKGDMPGAMKAFQQSVKINPNDAASLRNLGIVYYNLGRYEAAMDELTQSIAIDPNNEQSHNYLGSACSQKGWMESAEKEFLKAIAINDNFAEAHVNLALIYSKMTPPQLDKARQHYKKAIQLGYPKDDNMEKLLADNTTK